MSWSIGDNVNLFLKLKTKMEFYNVVPTTRKTSLEKLTFNVVGTQQIADIGKYDLKEENFCLTWAIYNGRRIICVKLPSDTEMLIIVVTRYRNNLYHKDNDSAPKFTKDQRLLSK